ncbi:alpha/beta fold hydrolase [Nocardia aurantiaca]|uniref:Alpha/beta fold hydrolase n=1 Tax=Nocardia aurantiaca TaxID=2675850 RepID=A0A6I3KW35_9NOCA|nr:alpha/beta fold hydrolase [Nocardia aurantiaca]MTE12675.1 alpha/beta fold hydrolase [Nocardia aurantiaca]
MGRVVELHTHRFGPSTGPAVLALHGLTGHGRRWQALACDHLPDVRVIAPDLRGHGRSPGVPPWDFETLVDDLAAVLERETSEPVVVVGHSFGAATAVHLAHRRPELVRALVLLDPAIGLEPERMLQIANAMLAAPDYASVEQARSDKLETSWAEVDPAILEAELAEHLVPTANGRVGWRMTLPAIIAFWGEIAREFVLPPRELPTVMVQAMKVDPPLVSPAFRAALTAHVGEHLTLREFDCDHMVAQSRPAETAALIRSVL